MRNNWISLHFQSACRRQKVLINLPLSLRHVHRYDANTICCILSSKACSSCLYICFGYLWAEQLGILVQYMCHMDSFLHRSPVPQNRQNDIVAMFLEYKPVRISENHLVALVHLFPQIRSVQIFWSYRHDSCKLCSPTFIVTYHSSTNLLRNNSVLCNTIDKKMAKHPFRLVTITTS